MNQKDYKNIAGIIKKDCENLMCNPQHYLDLVYDLADYFEKEDREGDGEGRTDFFNRQQFLKDCGIEND